MNGSNEAQGREEKGKGGDGIKGEKNLVAAGGGHFEHIM